MHNEPLLIIEDLRASYYKRPILNGVSLKVAAGEVVGILGPNGAGKSTLLKAIFGLIRERGGAIDGRILFDGEDIGGKEPVNITRIGVGYLLQGGEVFTNLTIQDNLILAANNLKGDFKKQEQFVYSLFPKLKALGKKRAGLLSGGERKMLALGMILMSTPKLLLLDEPTASLSIETAGAISKAISQIRQEYGPAILLVEQNVDKCLALSDRVCFMRDGQVVDELVGSLGIEEKLEQLFFV